MNKETNISVKFESFEKHISFDFPEGVLASELLLNALYASPEVDGVTCNIAGLPIEYHPTKWSTIFPRLIRALG